MNDERSVNIIYDVVNKAVFIQYGGQSHYLEGPYCSRKVALEAAASFCKSAGWSPVNGPADTNTQG
jgi:hypothetical protein